MAWAKILTDANVSLTGLDGAVPLGRTTSNDLDPSWLPDETPAYVSTVTINYNDAPFLVAALAANEAAVAVPTGFAIDEARIQLATSFAGTGITTLTCTVGVASNEALVMRQFDLLQTTAGPCKDTISSSISFSSAGNTSVKIYLTAAGANLDQLSAGQVKLEVRMSKPTTAIGGGRHSIRIPGNISTPCLPIYFSADTFTSNGQIVSFVSDSTGRNFVASGAPAPASAQYLTLANDGTLTNERVLTPGIRLAGTDGGANSTYTVDANLVMNKYFEVWEDFITVGASVWQSAVSGGSAGTDPVGASTEIGSVLCATGTSTTGRGGRTTDVGMTTPGGGEQTFEAKVRVNTLDDGTDTYKIFVGFHKDMTTVPPADGIFFEYDKAASVNWYCVAVNGGSRTTANSSTAVGTGWVILKIVVASGGATANFYINGSSVATAVSVAYTGTLGTGMNIKKTAGTNTRTMNVDWAYFKKIFTTAR